MLKYLIQLVILGCFPLTLFAQCNGHVELCDKRYNEVAYLTTHNAFNAAEDGFALPNHNFGLTQQLEDGVRGLMLDVYDEGGVSTVYHGFSFLGTATLESNLIEIKDFLDANPNEIVTIIFESYINSAMMDEVFTQVGLIPMLHAQTLGQPWPTLQEMVSAGKRLVVLSDDNDAALGQDWYHYVWGFAVETGFSNNSPSDFDCEFNRGNATNDLFIVNHFVTDATLGTGQPNQAEIINEVSFFYDRVYGCELEQQKFPNFPTVDFYELGQTMAVVDSLNGIQSSVGINDVSGPFFAVYPNPGNGQFQIKLDESLKNSSYQVFNVHGLLIESGLLNTNTVINLSKSPQGVYFLSVENDGEKRSARLIKM